MLCDVLLFWQQSDVSDDSEIFVSLKTRLISKTCLANKLLCGVNSQSCNFWSALCSLPIAEHRLSRATFWHWVAPASIWNAFWWLLAWANVIASSVNECAFRRRSSARLKSVLRRTTFFFCMENPSNECNTEAETISKPRELQGYRACGDGGSGYHTSARMLCTRTASISKEPRASLAEEE